MFHGGSRDQETKEGKRPRDKERQWKRWKLRDYTINRIISQFPFDVNEVLTGDPLMIYKSLEQDRWRFFRHIPIIIIFLSLSTGRLPFLISLWQLLSERSGYDNGFTKRLIYFLSGTSLGHRESETKVRIPRDDWRELEIRNLVIYNRDIYERIFWSVRDSCLLSLLWGTEWWKIPKIAPKRCKDN